MVEELLALRKEIGELRKEIVELKSKALRNGETHIHYHNYPHYTLPYWGVNTQTEVKSFAFNSAPSFTTGNSLSFDTTSLMPPQSES